MGIQSMFEAAKEKAAELGRKAKELGGEVKQKYHQTVEHVTGAKVARDVDAFQQEMETIYAAVAARIVSIESEAQALASEVDRLERAVRLATWTAIAGIVVAVVSALYVGIAR